MWRDPLDELIEDLERVVPAEAPSDGAFYKGYLEDLQHMVSSTLYGDGHVPPDYDQRMARLNNWFERSARTQQEAARKASADQRSETTLQCTCGAEEDVPHTRGCPLFAESL